MSSKASDAQSPRLLEFPPDFYIVLLAGKNIVREERKSEMLYKAEIRNKVIRELTRFILLSFGSWGIQPLEDLRL